MKIKKCFWISACLCFLLLNCTENGPLSPLLDNLDTVDLDKRSCGKENIVVMSRNVYVGGDVDKLLAVEDPNQIPFLVTEVFQEIQSTNFPERAVAISKEIMSKQPHLVGLQEVSLIRIQSPGDYVMGGSVPAETVVIDYLEVLLNTMASMGLDYEVVAKIQNVDVEMPMITSAEPTFDDVRLTDFDVILAKRGIQISNVLEKNYQIRIVLPEMGLEVPRGFAAVTASIDGNKYRFVNTHLEDADQGGPLLQIQMAQAKELLHSLAGEKLPVILVGDFNSAAPDEPTYKLITSSNKYKDTWLINNLSENPEGLTYGHNLDLLNPTQKFWKRIDFVFVKNGRGGFSMKLNYVTAEVVGDEEADKTPSGLWPSDHGGVIANLHFEKNERRLIRNK